jgi:hypothetical protein
MPFSSPDGRYHPFKPLVNQAPKKNPASTVVFTFGEMLTGLRDHKDGGGFGGLKAPMASSTFIFMFFIIPLFVLIAFLH